MEGGGLCAAILLMHQMLQLSAGKLDSLQQVSTPVDTTRVVTTLTLPFYCVHTQLGAKIRTFDSGVSPVHDIRVECTGSESNILQCTKSDQLCRPLREAGVMCLSGKCVLSEPTIF